MPPEEITLALFTVCNSVRVVAYLPQIHKAATDKNGASSVSFMTWMLFLLAHLSTVAYALVNRSDWGVGGLLLDQRHMLRCHIGGRVSNTPDTREAVDGSASSFYGGLIRTPGRMMTAFGTLRRTNASS